MITTYPGQESRAIQWAIDRELITADGAPLKATKQGQHLKTIEEIGEATEALGWLRSAKEAGCITGEVEDTALELGDILVTLCIQAAMNGSNIDQCIFEAGRLGTGYGEDWHLGQDCNPPCTWQYVETWASYLQDALVDPKAPYRFDALSLIGAMALGTEEIARIELSLMGPECLSMALDKIEGRQGEMVDGIFVKAAPCS